MVNTKSNTTEKKELPKFDDSGTSYLTKFINMMEYIYKLIIFYVSENMTEFGFILLLITYIIIMSIIFAKNPYDIITNTNEGLSIFLTLCGGFLIILLMFFFNRKKELFENEQDNNTETISFIGKLFSSIMFICLIIGLVFVIFYLSSYFSNFSSFLLMGTNILIFVGLFTLIIKYFGIGVDNGEPQDKSPSWLKLLIKIITFIPCLILEIVDYFKNQYQITTKPIIILFLSEIILICLYFIMPWIIEKVMYHNTNELIRNPKNLNVLTNLGSFQDINYTTSINDNKEFSYKFAISGWFYINSNPPETNPHYDEYTSILNVGDKPNIQFNVLKNKLRIKMKTQGNNEKNIYQTTNFPMQKWNNIIINYDGLTFDIFINNELVSSTTDDIPYKSNTLITSGTNNGLYGGICNVKYFRNNISRGKINWLYNSVNNLNPPII